MATYFWRARCAATNRELKFKTKGVYWERIEDAAEWVGRHYRNLTVLEFAPWDEAMHGGVIYPVPVQNVRLDAPKPDLSMPDPKRRSLLMGRILRKRLLTA